MLWLYLFFSFWFSQLLALPISALPPSAGIIRAWEHQLVDRKSTRFGKHPTHCIPTRHTQPPSSGHTTRCIPTQHTSQHRFHSRRWEWWCSRTTWTPTTRRGVKRFSEMLEPTSGEHMIAMHNMCLYVYMHRAHTLLMWWMWCMQYAHMCVCTACM